MTNKTLHKMKLVDDTKYVYCGTVKNLLFMPFKNVKM